MRTAGAKGDKSNASARWQRLLQRVAPASLLAFLLAAVLVPVFADETGWRLQERAWIDGGFDVAYSDVCGPNSVARAPVFMLPVRAFSAVVNLHLADPLFIRIEGVLCALGWLALFWILTAQVVPGARRRSDVRTLSCAILGMGFLPLMMVVSRPEQPHILTATLAIVIALARWPAGTVMARTWAKVLVIVVLDAIALSYHIKGVLYSLIFLACVLACSRRRRDWPVKLVAVGVILVLTAIALQYWFKRFDCPSAIVSTRQMGADLLSGRLSSVISQIPEMLAASSPLNYVRLAAATSEPMSIWLPWGRFPALVSVAMEGVLLVAWGLALTIAIMKLVNYGFARKWRALVDPRMLIALAIMAMVLVWGASQLKRNDYEAAHVLPMLAVFIVLCMGIPRRHAVSTKLLSWLVVAAVPLALVTEAVVAIRVFPSLYEANQQPGPTTRHPYSLSILGYDKVRADISTVMAEVGIPGDRRLHRVVVDEVTYLALQESYRPYHILADFINFDPVSLARYLVERDSDGIVISCRHMRPGLRAIAAESGRICAVSRQQLEKLTGSG